MSYERAAKVVDKYAWEFDKQSKDSAITHSRQLRAELFRDLLRQVAGDIRALPSESAKKD